MYSHKAQLLFLSDDELKDAIENLIIDHMAETLKGPFAQPAAMSVLSMMHEIATEELVFRLVKMGRLDRVIPKL